MNILNISYCLPNKRESVYEASKRLNIPNAQAKVFEKLFGLKMLPIDSDSNIFELLLKAANQCLEDIHVNRDQIKYLIYAHTANQVTPFGESCVMQLQRQLKLINAVSFSTAMSKCASVFVAFNIAQNLFDHLDENEYVIILTADVTFTKILQYIPGTTITSDGACAILLTKKHVKNRLVQIEIKNYGEFAGGIWNEKSTERLFEKKYTIYLSEVIQKVMSKANKSVSEIQLIIPHNVNTFSWLQVITFLNLDASQVFLENVSKTAHCFGVDPFLNLKDAMDKYKIQKGDYYILATVGLGATFAAMLFQY